MINLVSTSNNFYEEELNILITNPIVQNLTIEADEYLKKYSYQIPDNSICKDSNGKLIIAINEYYNQAVDKVLLHCYNLRICNYCSYTKYQLIAVTKQQLNKEIKEIVKYNNKVVKELIETNLVLEAVQYKVK